MAKFSSLLGATSLLAVSAFHGNVYAQTTDTSAIDEILVTARKRTESIQDAPLSITAFNARAIEDAGIRETADFIQLTSNVTLAESQSVSTSFLTIRGLTQVRNGEIPVAVVIDGVLQFNNRQFVQQLFDVQQIEVVKGPQGALYGRNAAGGAIIINTKRPSNETEGYVKFGYGKGDEVLAEGSISTPIVEDQLFVRLSGRVINRSGYFTNITRQEKDDPFLTGRFVVDCCGPRTTVWKLTSTPIIRSTMVAGSGSSLVRPVPTMLVCHLLQTMKTKVNERRLAHP